MMPGGGMQWLPADALRAAHHAGGGGSAQLWTIAAVVAAFVGSAIVAWQAVETHRTTTLSQRALEASYSMAIDSARARLDQDAPRIDVYVEQVSVLPVDSTTAGLAAALTAVRAPWILSRDGARFLRVQARVRVINLMNDRTIHLKVKGMQDQAMHADTEVLLVPAAKLQYFLTAAFPLDQWAENWHSHHDGKPPPNVAEGCVIAMDDRDEGVVDMWPLRLAAWPFQPEGNSDGAWQLTAGIAGNDWFDIAIRPLRERSYWISQRNNVPMPEPTYYTPR